MKRKNIKKINEFIKNFIELEDNMEREEKFAYIIETEMAIKAVHRGHKCTDIDMFAQARIGIKSDKK
jgi:hypothetical protein